MIRWKQLTQRLWENNANNRTGRVAQHLVDLFKNTGLRSTGARCKSDCNTNELAEDLVRNRHGGDLCNAVVLSNGVFDFQ